jgi:hypothetical protein
MIEEVKQDIKYSSYTPAQKKASQLYRQNNKEKINEQRKRYYQSKKESDPKFLEYKRIKAREYYEKKKLDKVVKPDVVPIVETKEPDLIEMTPPDIVKEAAHVPLPVDEVIKPMDTLPEEPTKKRKSKKEKKQ